MKRTYHKWLLVLALTGLLPLLEKQVVTAEVVDRIVAEVNNEIITMSELKAAAKSMLAQAGIKPRGREGKEIERKMLEALIDRKLAKAEAKRRGIKVEKKEVDLAVADFRKRNGLADDEAYKKALNQAGLTVKEMREEISDQIIQSRLITVAVRAKSVVSDAEVRQIYDEKYKEKAGAQLHLRVAKMPFPSGATEAQKEEIKKKAETVIAEVRSGASFPAVAKKHSLNETDVGFIALDDLDPRLAEFLGRLKPKEVGPALSPDGIQLFYLAERRSGKPKAFEEAAPEIRRLLSQKGSEKQFQEWVKTLREKAHIKIML